MMIVTITIDIIIITITECEQCSSIIMMMTRDGILKRVDGSNSVTPFSQKVWAETQAETHRRTQIYIYRDIHIWRYGTIT